MKNKMPLDGLGLGHDSGSVHCDMLKMLCFRTASPPTTTSIAEVAEQVEYNIRNNAHSIISSGTLPRAISLCRHRSCVGICHARYRWDDTADALRGKP